MMKKSNKKKLLVLGLGAVAAAATISVLLPPKRQDTEYDSFDLKVPSKRNTDIHCTVVLPKTLHIMPLVILAHGFGADRHEGGRFTMVANKLGSMGIASIRMDFPGCNDSKESYQEYHLSNMISDIKSCINYMITNYLIDEKHLGIIGYSMGGRLATIYACIDHRIKTMALWAPALTVGFNDLEDFMGGKAKLDELRSEAENKGFVRFNDPFGGVKELSKAYFNDMDHYDPLTALRAYQHNLLIIQGNQDDIVKPPIINKAIKQLNERCHFNYLYMDHANHGFGLWDEHPEQSEKLVKTTVSFFKHNL